MKTEARELIKAYPKKLSSGYFLSAWDLDSADSTLLFGIFTSHDFGEVEVSSGDSLVIISEEISETDLLSVIPETLDEQIKIEFSVDQPDVGSITFDQYRQPRLCRRTSQEMEGFGMEYPALCVEYWPMADSTPSIEEEQEVALRNSLKDHFDVDFDEHSEYLGTILAAIEDRRAWVRFNETGEELARRLHEDVETLNDDEILDLHDTWIIETKLVPANELEITLRQEEYGQLLNEKPVNLDSSNSVSEDAAIEFIQSEQRVPSRLALRVDSTQRYELPDIPASGASEMILKITYDGVLLDEYSMPLMRHIDLNVNVMSDSSSSPSADTPELIFEPSDYTVGRYSWDKRLALSGEIDLGNWVVEDETDHDEVMEVVQGSLSGIVKIVDPYLRPRDLSDIVAMSDQDVNMWVITALPSREMPSHRNGFENIVTTAGQDGEDLHISWVPDSPTPLHDRFLLSKECSLTFGTSFNSLQSNLTIVHEISEEKAVQLEQNFDYWWTDNRFKNQNNVEVIDTTY